MTLDGLICKMQETAEEGKRRLDGLGLDVSIEYDYLTKFLKPTEILEKARIITVSLVIRYEGMKEGDEYCISLGADNNRGKASDDEFSIDAKEFLSHVDEVVNEANNFSSPSDAVKMLADKANLEYEKITADLEKQAKISTTGVLIAIGGLIILFVVAILVNIWR